MLSPPADLALPTLAAALALGWGITAAALDYRPVGWGSHHWQVTDPTGARHFATVDELDRRQPPIASAYATLHAALSAAADLRAAGLEFVAAPLPTVDGHPVLRLTDRLSLAVFPFIDGESFTWGEFPTGTHARAMLDMLIRLHTTPPGAQPARDDFTVPHRDAMTPTTPPPNHGPYARPAYDLITTHADRIRSLLARYDALVAHADPSRAVLTHGEPHPGNTMHAVTGWMLIDWDTALIAPPERDLWTFDPALHAIYAEATGVQPEPAMLELYRVRWTVADIAIDAHRFRGPHTSTDDDTKTWHLLQTHVTTLP